MSQEAMVQTVLREGNVYLPVYCCDETPRPRQPVEGSVYLRVYSSRGMTAHHNYGTDCGRQAGLVPVASRRGSEQQPGAHISMHKQEAEKANSDMAWVL